MTSGARQTIAVVWFKTTDLRIHDNEALCQAHSSGLPVLHLFVFDPRWYKTTPLCGFPRTGSLRARFQLESLDDLARRLDAKGHALIVRRGRSTESVFDELCTDFQVKAVFSSREVCSEELRVEQKVRVVLQRHGAGDLQSFWTFELHHHSDLPEDLRRRGSNSYTGYKNAFHSQCRPRAPFPVPNLSRTAPGIRWKKADPLPLDVTDLGLPMCPPPHPSAELHWVGGETAALARVQDYLFRTDALALDYVGSTNTPREGNSCTKEGAMSRLSPWLAHGCLSARMLYSEIKRYERERHKSNSTYWLVHELYWRDFVRFQSLLVGNKIFKIGGLYNRHPSWPWRNDACLLQRWIEGATGFPFLDAAMREIGATGYSCHVGRETAAWFLIVDLGLDWRMGAEWFESILIDYEPAANWFCWVFVCLIRATGGNGFREIGSPELPPCTRLQTVEVVFLSAQHDPDGDYIKRWVPELRELASGLPVREPWRSTGEPSAAVSHKGKANHQGSAEGPDRIQMARRTLTNGGKSVAVWWSCVAPSSYGKGKTQIAGWPQSYPLPIFPPASFFDIEKVANKARKQQIWKVAHVLKLRRALQRPGLSLAMGFASAESDKEGESEHERSPRSKTSSLALQASKGKGKSKGPGARSGFGGAHFQELQIDHKHRHPVSEIGINSDRKRRWGKSASSDIALDMSVLDTGIRKVYLATDDSLLGS